MKKKNIYYILMFFTMFLAFAFSAEAITCEYPVKIPDEDSYFYYQYDYNGANSSFVSRIKKKNAANKPTDAWYEVNDTFYNFNQILQSVPVFSKDGVYQNFTYNIKVNYFNAAKNGVSDAIANSYNDNTCPSATISYGDNNSYSFVLSFIYSSSGAGNKPSSDSGSSSSGSSSTSSKVNSKCEKVAYNGNSGETEGKLYKEIRDNKVYLKFLMYSDGKKTLQAYINMGGSTSESDRFTSAEVEVIDGTDTDLKINIPYKNTTLYFTLPASQISHFYSHNEHDKDENTIKCYPNTIYITDDNNAGGGYFWISTTNTSDFTHNGGTGNITHVQTIPFPDITDCQTLLGSPNDTGSPAYYLVFAFKVVRYVAIILLIVLSVIEFVTATASSDQESITKATKKTIRRFVLCIVIFALPTLLNFGLNFLYDRKMEVCGITQSGTNTSEDEKLQTSGAGRH